MRERLLLSANMPAGKLHSITVKLVCASFQSLAAEAIAPVLTDEELAVFKRGRNAHGNTIPKSSNACEYRRATGLESLFGYLRVIGDNDRILQLFDVIWSLYADNAEQNN